MLQPLSDAERAFKQNESALRLLEGSATATDKAVLGLDQSAKAATGSIGRLAQQIASIGGYGPRNSFAGSSPSFEGKNLLDLIGAAEGTDRGRGYNETLGYGKFTGGNVDLITMTLRQVMELQGRMLADPANTFDSSAVGRYQITRQTLQDFMPRLGLSPDTVFTPDVQDKIALAIANAAGRSVEALRGRWEGLKFVGADTITRSFDGEGSARSSVAVEQERARLAAETAQKKKEEAEATKLIAEATKRAKEEAASYAKNQAEMLKAQAAFIDQFRGIGDGLVTSIAQAREAGESWTKAFGAGLDTLKAKALSILDSFISKALDSALFGQPGTAGGGLLGGLLGGLFGGTSNPMQNALGNAFENGRVTPFALGTVVASPTLFPMRGGMGSMAEAGPEAIMPLQRTASGHLGVRAAGGGGVSVTVNNMAGAEVKTSTRQRPDGGIDIELMLERKMAEYLGRDDVVQAQAMRLGTRPPAAAWG